jgi:hypothetical protein
MEAVVTAPIVRAPFHNTHESFYFFLDFIFISRTHVWWEKPQPITGLGFIALGITALGITSHLVNFYFNYKFLLVLWKGWGALISVKPHPIGFYQTLYYDPIVGE